MLTSSVLIALLLGGCNEHRETRVSPNLYHDLQISPNSDKLWYDESPVFSRCSCDSATYCLTDQDVMIIHMIYAQNNQKNNKRIKD